MLLFCHVKQFDDFITTAWNTGVFYSWWFHSFRWMTSEAEHSFLNVNHYNKTKKHTFWFVCHWLVFLCYCVLLGWISSSGGFLTIRLENLRLNELHIVSACIRLIFFCSWQKDDEASRMLHSIAHSTHTKERRILKSKHTQGYSMQQVCDSNTP